MPTVADLAEVARDASLKLNNAALRAPDTLWGEVQDICRQLDALAETARLDVDHG